MSCRVKLNSMGFPLSGMKFDIVTQQIEFLRKAEPTATFRLYRSLKKPTTFLWYEVYESQAAHENHLKVVMPSFRKELGPAPKGLFSKPPEIESYVELAK